jgi:two-component sensor histidine kinase
LSWGLGENIKNNKDAIKEKIQDKLEVARLNNNNSSVSSTNKELIHQFKNNFTTIEDLEEALASAVKEQGKENLIEDIQTTIEKKVIVAENLYKKLNENDLEEIANLLVAIRVLDESYYLHLFDNIKKYQFYNAVNVDLQDIVKLSKLLP